MNVMTRLLTVKIVQISDFIRIAFMQGTFTLFTTFLNAFIHRVCFSWRNDLLSIQNLHLKKHSGLASTLHIYKLCFSTATTLFTMSFITKANYGKESRLINKLQAGPCAQEGSINASGFIKRDKPGPVCLMHLGQQQQAALTRVGFCWHQQDLALKVSLGLRSESV